MIMLKNIEYMVRFKSTMLELRVNTPFGKEYGFICTCITGSTKFPNSNPFLNISVYKNASSPIKFTRKSSLSVVSRVS